MRRTLLSLLVIIALVVESNVAGFAHAQDGIPGSISGCVTDGAGEGIQGIQIAIIEYHNGEWQPLTTITDLSGSYKLEGITPGDYIVRATPPTESYLQAECYDDAEELPYALPVTVEAGKQTTGINFSLNGQARVAIFRSQDK